MLHPPKKEKMFDHIIFRNDDVSADTNIEHFKKFCELFHEFGYVQLHAVTLRGNCNLKYVIDGIPCMYDEINPYDIYYYDKCIAVSHAHIEENIELIDYLNSIPDPVALHGLYHSNYSTMTYEQQYGDIKEGLELMHKLFPNKKIDTFVAPFNLVNEDTYKVCDLFGLRVSALEGEHLEDRMHHGKGPLYEGEVYRYHHHRFYPESTFTDYDLSIENTRKYFEKYSFNYNERMCRAVPSNALFYACMGSGFDINCAGIMREVKSYVHKYVKLDEVILDVNCNNTKFLFELSASGYNSLIGYNKSKNVVEGLNQISETMKCGIDYYQGEINELSAKIKIKSIICINKAGDQVSAYDVFHYSVKLLDQKGYLILANMTEGEGELIDLAGKFNAMLVDAVPYETEKNKQRIFVFKRYRPKICLLCDRPNWAHDNSAQEIKKYLSDEFDVSIKYVIDKKKIDINSFDAFEVFFWGEQCYQKSLYSKNRLIKQVSSHRWQFDKPYGPLTVQEFSDKYLNDAETVICPSKILYNMLRPIAKNLFLCGKGYAPELFYYTKERDGEMRLCMVGNLKDPVKGVDDLLLPAADGYNIDIEQFLKHEELKRFYNDHDIYVVSSVHEADPLPLIESMACGCFPVASKIGIAPELIRHKENGYLVEERNIEEFRKAFKWCGENLVYIRKQAKKNAEEMYRIRRWEVMAENYREMFRNHIGRK